MSSGSAQRPRPTHRAHASSGACDETLLEDDQLALSQALPPSQQAVARHRYRNAAAAFAATQVSQGFRPPRRYLPIWYALPSLDGFRRVRASAGDSCSRKLFDFAPMRPGRMKTYRFETQDAYYSQYAHSLFALTMPRAGLDCLRHYEILASGAIPFFIHSEALNASPLSMYAFPRELVRQAAALPGVPSEAEVERAWQTDAELHVNHTAFDLRAYCMLRARLLAHTEAKLTTTTLARYVLEQLALANPAALPHAMARGASSPVGSSVGQFRVLLVSSKGVSGDTWENAWLYHGLVSLLGNRGLSSWLGRKEVLYDDFVYPHRFCCYGRGYSYARTLPTPHIYQRCGKERADALLRAQLRRRLDAGYFNAIIVTTMSNRCCRIKDCYGDDVARTINAYLRRRGNATAVATVDGSDGFGGCRGGATMEHELEHVDVHFLREVDVKHSGSTAARVIRPVSELV